MIGVVAALGFLGYPKASESVLSMERVLDRESVIRPTRLDSLCRRNDPLFSAMFEDCREVVTRVPDVDIIMEDIVWDRAKGELQIVGKRHVALDAEALCRHLDDLVGMPVAEVIVRNHEVRLGKEDAERHRKEKPDASVEEIIATVRESDLLSGIGLTKFTVQGDQSVLVEISNPCVNETAGAAKSLLFGYYSGVFSFLFGKEYDEVDVKFNKSSNVLSARLVPRGVEV